MLGEEAVGVALRLAQAARQACADQPDELIDVLSASLSADGTHVVTASDEGLVRVWDLSGEQPNFVVLKGHLWRVTSASFSADGAHLVTASWDKTARVWDLRGDRPSFVALEGHQDWVTSASFSADGKYVVTASDDGTARVWDGTILGIERRANPRRAPYCPLKP
jgi:WD40 repeat protein